MNGAELSEALQDYPHLLSLVKQNKEAAFDLECLMDRLVNDGWNCRHRGYDITDIKNFVQDAVR